ncbi:hypothetical protein CF95_gp159 [Erwinia phage PhiEaH1]|uniref:Uncharacterized protein n=1 Tax=Erwinia phage PhiEaH1 TaxID=1401669 RepID=W8CZF7_9CAUD|nr:hypothetical protein CF95_gp159 [Erwinia phage PhiEaH1]AGX01882.1 hypothetical protein [Erwinia phage PhiEaH1]
MKVSEFKINTLIIGSLVLAESANYLRDTTDIGKAASGRKAQGDMEQRAEVLRNLVRLHRDEPDYELSQEEEEVIQQVRTYFADTMGEIEADKAIPEGEELLVLPTTYPDVNFKGSFAEFMTATIYYAIATRTRSQEDIGTYLDYIENRTCAPMIKPILKAIDRCVDKHFTNEMDLKATMDFGHYLNIHSWKEMGNAIENLANRVNAKESAPTISELTLSLDDFDRIGSAVDAMYGTSRVAVTLGGRERSDIPGERPVPHYTRANKSRNPNVVLVLKGGKIDGVSFTGF